MISRNTNHAVTLLEEDANRAGRSWGAQRLPAQLVHLDTAAAGRASTATLQAAAAHAEREAVVGAYIAQGEAEAVLETGRAELGRLLGFQAGGLAFVESASAALGTLLSAWPLDAGDTVAVVPSEWGPNLAAFDRRGLGVVQLAVHGDGTVDLADLERVLADTRPAFVHLTQVASHRGLVQPVAQAALLCRAAGVALWVDAAQALGQVETACGADVVYSTSRKWMTGPRGVGMLAVADRWWDTLRVSPSPLARSSLPDDCSTVRLLESTEANIAGRIGLCTAVRQHLDARPAEVWQRLAEVGRLTRQMLDDLPGWVVIDPLDAPSAITALRPAAGQDVVDTRARLLADYSILTTACSPARAPLEMTEPLLRISPHLDCSAEAIALLRTALTSAL